MLAFLKKQISLNSGILLFVIGFCLSFSLFYSNGFRETTAKSAYQPAVGSADCEVTNFRNTSYQFTSPLLYVEKSCESPDFQMAKSEIQKMIADFKASNDITAASVYLRDFRHSRWMGGIFDCRDDPWQKAGKTPQRDRFLGARPVRSGGRTLKSASFGIYCLGSHPY